MKRIFIENHKDYLELLNVLNKRAKYFYIGYNNEFEQVNSHYLIEYCNKHLKPIGTIMSDKYYADGNPLVMEYQYEIEDGKMHYHFFEFLKHVEIPFDEKSFGLDDIAFLDVDKNYLCNTITHEDMFFVTREIFNKL